MIERQKRTDIQGLRAIAVGTVVLYHAGIPFVPGGYIGVDVFFVISGFLITTHLLESLERDGRIRFGSFYAKRARRLLPAALTVVVLTVVAALVVIPPLQLRNVFTDATATTLYVPNVLFATQGVNYLAETTPSLFQHYWSLGVEEQFYLLWPVLLMPAFKLIRSRRRLIALVAVVVAVSFVASLVLSYSSKYQPIAFFTLPTRAWELGVGALVAFALLQGRAPLKRSAAVLAGWGGIALIVGSACLMTSGTLFPGWAAAVPVIGTALVILAGAKPSPRGPQSMLSLQGMTFIGDISYSLYLVHWPLLVIPQAVAGYSDPLPLWVTSGIAIACVPLAWLMYRFVEGPGRTLRILTTAPARRTLITTLAAMVVITSLSAAARHVTDERELDAGKPAADTVVQVPPAATDYVPSNLRPGLRQAEDDVPSLYDKGCHLDFAATDPEGCTFGNGSRRVVLFGDSHAAQWFPALQALASSHDLTIETHTKSSCASADVDSQRNGATYNACIQWRKAVVEKLVAESPSLVLLGNFGPLSVNGSKPERGWERGLRSTIESLTGSSPVAVFVDTPNLGETPAICLSAHLNDASDCGRSRSAALASPVRPAERDAIAASGAATIDMTDYICAAAFCPPIIGNTLVYRDAHHLTATYSSELSDALWLQIEPLLADGR